jgi:hypothetical protein
MWNGIITLYYIYYCKLNLMWADLVGHFSDYSPPALESNLEIEKAQQQIPENRFKGERGG